MQTTICLSYSLSKNNKTFSEFKYFSSSLAVKAIENYINY